MTESTKVTRCRFMRPSEGLCFIVSDKEPRPEEIEFLLRLADELEPGTHVIDGETYTVKIF